MKAKRAITATVFLLIFASTLIAQERRRQIEVFFGGAIPLAPELFKDWYEAGGSLHGQYVIFPSPKLGISFGLAAEGFAVDEDAVLEDFGLTGSGVSIDASLSILEVGVGVRPYLTPLEANTQIYLFGMGTYNSLRAETKVSGFGQTESDETSEGKIGLALGAGAEMPATESFNLLIQGLWRFIFTEDETTSFLGITFGLAF